MEVCFRHQLSPIIAEFDVQNTYLLIDVVANKPSDPQTQKSYTSVMTERLISLWQRCETNWSSWTCQTKAILSMSSNYMSIKEMQDCQRGKTVNLISRTPLLTSTRRTSLPWPDRERGHELLDNGMLFMDANFAVFPMLCASRTAAAPTSIPPAPATVFTTPARAEEMPTRAWDATEAPVRPSPHPASPPPAAEEVGSNQSRLASPISDLSSMPDEGIRLISPRFTKTLQWLVQNHQSRAYHTFRNWVDKKTNVGSNRGSGRAIWQYQFTILRVSICSRIFHF